MSPRSLRAAAVVILLPAFALADPAPVEPSLGLRWADPKQLSPTTEGDFSAQLAARLGRPAFAVADEGLSLSINWQGTAERCRVELSLARAESVEGTRVIESPSGDCRSVLPAVLTVSALLVESYESAHAPPPAPVSPPRTTPEPPPPAPLPPPPAPSSARVLLSAAGVLSSGFAPKVEIGPALGAVFAPHPAFRVGISGTLFVGHDYGEGPGLSLDHRRGALFACGMPLHGDRALGFCMNLGAHQFHASGTSLLEPDEHDLLTWSAGAELRAEWRLSRRLWWVGQAGADVATRPQYFYYTAASGAAKTVFEQQRISPILLIGLGVEVP